MTWDDRIVLLSVNPEIASRDEVAQLAADLMEARRRIKQLEAELEEADDHRAITSI